jgi:hypothetical protein
VYSDLATLQKYFFLAPQSSFGNRWWRLLLHLSSQVTKLLSHALWIVSGTTSYYSHLKGILLELNPSVTREMQSGRLSDTDTTSGMEWHCWTNTGYSNGSLHLVKIVLRWGLPGVGIHFHLCSQLFRLGAHSALAVTESAHAIGWPHCCDCISHIHVGYVACAAHATTVLG